MRMHEWKRRGSLERRERESVVFFFSLEGKDGILLDEGGRL